MSNIYDEQLMAKERLWQQNVELRAKIEQLQEAVQYWVALWEKAGTAAIRLQGENAERLAERDDLRQQLAAAERKLREDVPSFLRHCPGVDEITCIRAVNEFHKWLDAQAEKEKSR